MLLTKKGSIKAKMNPMSTLLLFCSLLMVLFEFERKGNKKGRKKKAFSK